MKEILTSDSKFTVQDNSMNSKSNFYITSYTSKTLNHRLAIQEKYVTLKLQTKRVRTDYKGKLQHFKETSGEINQNMMLLGGKWIVKGKSISYKIYVSSHLPYKARISLSKGILLYIPSRPSKSIGRKTKQKKLKKTRNAQSLPKIEASKNEAVPLNIETESLQSNGMDSETERFSNMSKPHKLSPIRHKPKSRILEFLILI
jgi:hypothetical protein